MASIARDKGGKRRILFVAPDGRRPTIRLGKVSQRMAEAVKFRVEQLLAAKLTGHAVEADTARWMAELPGALADKLAKVGLLPKRESAMLGTFLDAYISARTDAKPSTKLVWGHTHRCLVEYLGAKKPLREITPGDADAWRLWLGEHERLAENTVNRRCGIAKQFFRAAFRRKLITENPFADMKGCAVRGNRARDYFVTRPEATKVLDACPDAQWRLLFALSRYGGLRCPSEHLALKWRDVDWERGRITIRASKTAHHADGGIRTIPIFPELRRHLEAVWEQAEPGTEYVITRYRDSNTNLGTQLRRIIAKAGLKPWPKLWQNLRATRETELAETYPIHVVCAWIGNSQAVAQKHYLQVTDEHFEAAQNAAQQAHAQGCNEPQVESKPPVFSEQCDAVRLPTSCKVGDTGLEPVTSAM